MYCSFVSLNSRVVNKTSGLSVVGWSSEDTPSRTDGIKLLCECRCLIAYSWGVSFALYLSHLQRFYDRKSFGQSLFLFLKLGGS